jgi:hypothetical protein
MDRNVEIANALTAILLQAESIRQRAKQDQTEVGTSAAHIILNAKRVWRSLGAVAG